MKKLKAKTKNIKQTKKRRKKKSHKDYFMISLKFAYKLIFGDKELLERYEKQATSLVHIFYNLLVDNPKMTCHEANDHIKGFKNLDLMDSYMVLCAYRRARSMYKRYNKEREEPLGHKLIFGKRKNLIKTSKHTLTKKEFKKLRILPLFLEGQKDSFANRRVRIKDKHTLEFVVNGKVIFVFRVSDKRCGILNQLKKKQDAKQMPITYTIGDDYITITYNQKLLTVPKNHNLLANRIMSIDMNPDYIGITIFDVDQDSHIRNILKAYVIDWSTITELQKELKQASNSESNKYLTNKRKHEIKNVGKFISDLSVFYKCKYIAIEDLDFDSNCKGFRNSKWNRNLVFQSLFKHSVENGVTILRVNPAYTSIIGNIVCRHNIPDMCRSAYEIGYRAVKGLQNGNFDKDWVDTNQYLHSLDKIKLFITKSLEECGGKDKELKEVNKLTFNNVNEFIHRNKIRYRVSIEDCKDNETVYIFKNDKSLVKIHSYSVRHYKKTIA